MIHPHKHLMIDDEIRKIYYLGYNLNVTKIEYNVILSLVGSEDGVAAGAFFDASKNESISHKSAKVHICNINKRSKSIGERKLICFDGEKYRLNEYM